nr:unnamed protein product [Callosobruchus chinensis]
MAVEKFDEDEATEGQKTMILRSAFIVAMAVHMLSPNGFHAICVINGRNYLKMAVEKFDEDEATEGQKTMILRSAFIVAMAVHMLSPNGFHAICLWRLSKEVEEDEAQRELIGSDSENEEDFEGGSNHDSDSEQDVEEEIIVQADEDEQATEEQAKDSVDKIIEQVVAGPSTESSSSNSEKKINYYLERIGQNGLRNVRTPKQNIITHLPGVKRVARDAKTPVECFDFLFDNQMIEDIVKWTNYTVRNTDRKEIRAVIGLLYLVGTYKAAKLNIEDLFATDGTGIEKFRKTMSLQRFTILLSCLRFDNVANREERKKIDKLAALRSALDKFVENSQNIYTPSEYLTIDEKLEAFRGRCAFRQFMPNKPARYEVYVGAQPDGPFSVSNKPFDVALRLIKPISGTGRNVTFDNWFTSYELLLHLLKYHNLTAVGTLRKNKAQIPPNFLKTRGREELSSTFGFQENILITSYVPRKNKVVLLMSTFHLTPDIDPRTEDEKKPEVITFYNCTNHSLWRLWKEVEEDEAQRELIGSDSENEEDFEGGSNHDRDSEQDVEEEIIVQADEDEQATEEQAKDSVDKIIEQVVAGPSTESSSSNSEKKINYYFGKDRTKWAKVCYPRNVRTPKQNIITHLPGVKRVARDAKTPVECFDFLFDNQMIEDIVKWTNYTVRNTDRKEIRAVIGLLYLVGTYKAAKLNIEDLFATDGTGIEKFRKTIEERKKIDKLAALRSALDKFVENSQNIYTPSEYLTIDEKLEAFRGRCAFRQFMPNKPARYEVYVGAQPDGPFSVSNKPFDVALRLIKPISGTGRNVTFDNWFTSYELLLHLLKYHNLTAVGTLRKNKAQIPPNFLKTRGREELSSTFGFQENILITSYVPRKNKVVLLMSTFHLTPDIDPRTEDEKKPEVITFYNCTNHSLTWTNYLLHMMFLEIAEDGHQQFIFFAMLNCTGINALVIHSANTGIIMKRRKFLKKLAFQLIEEYEEVRSQNPRLPRELQASQKRQCETNNAEPRKRQKNSKRCAKCPRNADRKTFYTCLKCNESVCLPHCYTLCDSCKNNV